ncbi:MAG: glyceraldehyde-3-phosphate dehydrogenase [Cereibacter changlensis]
MTDRLALTLALLILGLLAADLGLLHGDGTLFLSRKLSQLVEYLAVWR